MNSTTTTHAKQHIRLQIPPTAIFQLERRFPLTNFRLLWFLFLVKNMWHWGHEINGDLHLHEVEKMKKNAKSKGL